MSTDNWAAVAQAINQRAKELGLRQWELSERSGVSQAMIREIQLHTHERNRSGRTLEALSLALQWHPGHLLAVLHGKAPLEPGETGVPAVDEVPARLSAIESRLTDLAARISEVHEAIAEMRKENNSRRRR